MEVLEEGGDVNESEGLALFDVRGEEPVSPKAPPRRSMAEGLLFTGALALEGAAASTLGLVTCVGVADELDAVSVSGSGIGPSIAQRLLSYFERMNCSILCSGG